MVIFTVRNSSYSAAAATAATVFAEQPGKKAHDVKEGAEAAVAGVIIVFGLPRYRAVPVTVHVNVVFSESLAKTKKGLLDFEV